ncbi:unnamed protein product, partial [Ectocarpus fasciculatus]
MPAKYQEGADDARLGRQACADTRPAGGERQDGANTSTGVGGGESTKGKGKRKAAKPRPEPSSEGGAAAGPAKGESRSAWSRYAREEIKTEETAEMIYPAGEKSADADYHKNMDADTFMKWMEHRLVPAFKRRYPDKQMILVMDNAAYHHGMPEGWAAPLQSSKKANLATLRELQENQLDLVAEEVYGINVSRDGEIKGFALPLDGQEFAHYPAGPSKPELQRATFRLLETKAPEKLMTRAERFFKDNDLGYLLFTPPYCPALQPIELFWAYGKNYVAANNIQKGNLEDVHRLLLEGFYGMGEEKTNETVRKMVSKSLTFVNEYIEQDEVLSGSYDNLQGVPEDYKVSGNASLMSEMMEQEPGVNEGAPGE